MGKLSGCAPREVFFIFIMNTFHDLGFHQHQKAAAVRSKANFKNVIFSQLFAFKIYSKDLSVHIKSANTKYNLDRTSWQAE